MSRKTTLVFLVVYFVFYVSFSQGTWTQKAPFGGTARLWAVGFSIGTKGYIGTGTDGNNTQDFWEWDQTSDLWTQKANFPGIARFGAVGFSIGTKGYIGTGGDINSSTDWYSDFWEWDQSGNTWMRKADLGGAARYEAVGFSIGNKGYIGTGRGLGGAFLQDFWEWDQATDTWSQKAVFSGGIRGSATGFSIGNKGYIGTGFNGGANVQDFWEWDQATDTWAAKADFGGGIIEGAVGFSIGTKGYIGTGEPGMNDFWEWDQATDVWVQKISFTGAGRYYAVGFSIGCKGYIGTGGNNGLSYNDFWEWNPVTLSIASQNVLCNSQCNGVAIVTPISGTPPFTYLWNNSQTSQSSIGLCVGSYTCTITDSSGCSNNDSVVITEPDTLMINLLSQVSVDCNGNNTGSASVSALGGISPYMYLWNTSPPQSTSIASNLPAGIYTIAVADSNGCTTTDTITIIQPDSIAITIVSANATCNGNNDGSLTANVTGGTTPYTYSWSSGGMGVTENNLSAATYTVTVTDSNNCSATEIGIVEEPAVLAVSITSVNNVSCNGGNNGSATAGVTGGTMPYTYLWSSGGTGALENNLSAGTYTITVTDSNSCTDTQTVFIAEPAALIIDSTVTNVSCNGGNNGSAMAMVLGGIAPYAYSWSSGGTAATENSLSSGTYTLTVTDSNNCIASDTILVSEPLLLTVDVLSSVDVICNGGNNGSATAGANGGVAPYIYSWSSGSTTALANNLSAESYTVTVTDSNSCVSADSIIISQPPPISLTVNSTQAICTSNSGGATAIVSGGIMPYVYQWSTGETTAVEDSLTAGSYTVTVTDSNSCIQTQSINVSSTNPLTLTVISTPTACDMATGTATGTPANGTQPYTYTWTTSPVQTTSIATGLDSGSYTVTVVDSNGCSQNQSITINTAVSPTAVVAATVTTITLGNTTQLIALGGTNYFWTPVTGLSCFNCQNPAASPSETTTYCVTVSDTSNCTDSACITITVEIPCGKIEVPTAFSPNNDGHNDLFVLQGLGNCVESFSFIIFDRWGEKVFETESLSSLSWDGTYKGKPMNAAVFVYYIDATFISGEHIIKKGNISLIR